MRARRVEMPNKPSIPAEQRIPAAADRRFARFGIRAVTIRAIAEEAETNEETVVRYFGSKDRLILRYLERMVKIERAFWAELNEDESEKPMERLRGWLQSIQDIVLDGRVDPNELARAAADLTELTPLSKRFIRAHKLKERAQIARLCEKANCSEPKALADALYLLVEGARLGLECIGPDGPGGELVAASDTLIRAHLRKSAQPMRSR